VAILATARTVCPNRAPPGLWDIQNTVRETWCFLPTRWVRMCHVLFSGLYSHGLAHRMWANGCIPRRQPEAEREWENKMWYILNLSESLNLGLSLIIRTLFVFVFLPQVFLKVFQTSYKLAFLAWSPGFHCKSLIIGYGCKLKKPFPLKTTKHHPL